MKPSQSFKLLLATVFFALVFVALPSQSMAAKNYWPKAHINFTKSVNATQKATIKMFFKTGNPVTQRYITKLNGPFSISIKDNAQLSWASFRWNGINKPKYKITYSNLHVMPDNPYSKFLVWHEMGHLIQYSGISQKAEKRFRSIIKKSPNYKKCFPQGGGKCAAIEEVFADQIAFFATGDVNLRSGYNIPPLVDSKNMKKFLGKHYQIRGNRPAYLIK